MTTPFPDKMAFGDAYGPAMQITDQAEANAWFERLVEHGMRTGKPREAVEQTERINLGYWAGYYDNETRDRVERLFGCAHPIFGAIGDGDGPTPEEAFQKGVEKGRPDEERTTP